MTAMTFTSACCNAPVHTNEHGEIYCVKCNALLDAKGAPLQTSLFDYLWDYGRVMSDKEVAECVETGVFYSPYIPLQVTPVKLK